MGIRPMISSEFELDFLLGKSSRYAVYVANAIYRPQLVAPRHCAKIFLIRSTTSGGCSITSLAIFDNSSPVTAVISKFILAASANSAGSAKLFIKAARKRFVRPRGGAGWGMIGRPGAPEPSLNATTLRPRSEGFKSSMRKLGQRRSGQT